MTDRPYLEAKVMIEFDPAGRIFYSPLQTAFSGHREAVANGQFAEVTIPYHPADEHEPIYGFRCFIANKPADEPAMMEIIALQQHAADLYKQFAAFVHNSLDEMDEYED